MKNLVRYSNRPVWQFFLPRHAVFESDGIPLFEYSPASGDIRNLRTGEVLSAQARFGGRDYTLPNGSTLLLRSKLAGGWTVEKNGKKEEIVERWPSPTRRQFGTESVSFDCAIDSERIFRESSAVALEEAIIAFHAFYSAQPGDG
jgi:hypothetical protein